MRNLQWFVARQAVAIHQADSTVLVTVGSASELNILSQDGLLNYWSDHCLQQGLLNSDTHNDDSRSETRHSTQQNNSQTIGGRAAVPGLLASPHLVAWPGAQRNLGADRTSQVHWE